MISLGRVSLLTAFLAAFGRAIAEVGAILIVGRNIRDYTRYMTSKRYLDADAARRRKTRQQLAEQPRLLRRCRRGDGDRSLLRGCAADEGEHDQAGNRNSLEHVSHS
jgi:hypothetical protein